MLQYDRRGPTIIFFRTSCICWIFKLSQTSAFFVLEKRWVVPNLVLFWPRSKLFLLERVRFSKNNIRHFCWCAAWQTAISWSETVHESQKNSRSIFCWKAALKRVPSKSCLAASVGCICSMFFDFILVRQWLFRVWRYLNYSQSVLYCSFLFL